jgi:microcin C transport system substrate-binding protein
MKQGLFYLCVWWVVSVGTVTAGEKAPGVSVFGPESLKYDFGQTFVYQDPSSPRGGQLNVPMRVFSKLTPFGLKGRMASAVWNCWEPLAIKSWDDDEPYALYGVLAESFELADDKKSLIITLRPEAKFSDGMPVTADDVVFSYDVLFDPDFPPGRTSKWREVSKVEKLDDHRVKLHFKAWRRDLLTSVLRYFQIYPKHVYGKPGVNLGGDFLLKPPVGSGPYRVQSFEMGKEVTMVRRDGYWGDTVKGGLPTARGTWNFNTIHYRVFDWKTAHQDKLEAFKQGRLSYLDFPKPDVIDQLKKGDLFKRGLITIESLPWTRPAAMFCLQFNLNKPIWQDRELRYVINMLWEPDPDDAQASRPNRKRIVSYFNTQPRLRAGAGEAKGAVRDLLTALTGRHNRPGKLYVPEAAFDRGPHEAGTDAHGKRPSMKQRIETAKRRLDKLGWKQDPTKGVRVKNGQPLELNIIDRGSPGIRHFIKAMTQAGVRVSPSKKLSWEEQDEQIRQGQYDLLTAWLDGRMAPRASELSVHLVSGGRHNKSGLKNPAIDELLSVITTTGDRQKLGVYCKAFDRIMTAQWYAIPFYWSASQPAVYWSYLARPAIRCSMLSPEYAIPRLWHMDAERYRKVQHALRTGGSVQFPAAPAPRTPAGVSPSGKRN